MQYKPWSSFDSAYHQKDGKQLSSGASIRRAGEVAANSNTVTQQFPSYGGQPPGVIMSPKPMILFDIMDTLVTEPFYSAMPRFFEMTLDELLQAKHPTAWVEFEKGLISEAEYFTRFFSDRRAVDGEGLRQCVTDAYQWLDGMQQLIADLHSAGYAMHALSNYPIWYQLIEERLQLSRYLQWTFVSCHTGVRKPESAAFRGPLAKLGVAAADCLFIDDRPINVEAARTLGMDAILKQDASQVRAELVQRALL